MKKIDKLRQELSSEQDLGSNFRWNDAREEGMPVRRANHFLNLSLSSRTRGNRAIRKYWIAYRKDRRINRLKVVS